MIWVSRNLLPICAAQTHRRAESKTDWNFWKLRFNVWPETIASGKHRHGRRDLVLSVRSGIKTAGDGVMFTNFLVTKKRVVCKNPILKHCWSPSSTTKASSIRNLLLQDIPSMLHFTRQFWTNFYCVSGGFDQSCTGLENECCSTIMPLHTVRSMCANSWLRR